MESRGCGEWPPRRGCSAGSPAFAVCVSSGDFETRFLSGPPTAASPWPASSAAEGPGTGLAGRRPPRRGPAPWWRLWGRQGARQVFGPLPSHGPLRRRQVWGPSLWDADGLRGLLGAGWLTWAGKAPQGEVGRPGGVGRPWAAVLGEPVHRAKARGLLPATRWGGGGTYGSQVGPREGRAGLARGRIHYLYNFYKGVLSLTWCFCLALFYSFI